MASLVEVSGEVSVTPPSEPTELGSTDDELASDGGLSPQSLEARLHRVASERELSTRIERRLDGRVQGAVEALNAAIDRVNDVERLRAQAPPSAQCPVPSAQCPVGCGPVGRQAGAWPGAPRLHSGSL